jgi:hypothetical protein
MAFETRDFHGYRQTREVIRNDAGTFRTKWQFYISGFNEGTCSVLLFDGGYEVVPIDAKDRILINGKRYGREHWDH